ncbi:MAG TPA: hypothetical protein VKX31_07595, partial [Brumimicrobium sp.]|nr:hypothetical protein [Brumimicrobium sp.]
MKIKLLSVLLLFFFGLQTLFSQTYYKYYQDGLVVFQLKLDAKRILSKDQWVEFKNYPLFTDFLSGYDIVEVKQLHPDLDDELLNRTYQIRINDFTKVDDLAKVLGTHSTIEYAELKALHYSTFTPNDPHYGSTTQWGLFKIQAGDAWDMSLG